MSPRPGFLGRSALLIALAVGLPVREQDRLVEDLLQRFWALCPDLASQETRDAVVVDIKARLASSPVDLARALSDLGDLLYRWATGGRVAVVINEEPAVGERWRGVVQFNGPGRYSALATRVFEGRSENYMVAGLPTLPAANEAARKQVGKLRLTAAAELLGRALGHDVTGDVEALLNGRDHGFVGLKKALGRAAGRQARENSVEVGLAENGVITPVVVESAEVFTRRYGIRDDLVKEPPSPEQRAKMEALMDEVTAKRGPLPVSRGEWEPEDAADRAAKYIDVDGSAGPVTFDPFQRAQRMAMNTPADRAFARMGELSRRTGKAAEEATRVVGAAAEKLKALDLPGYTNINGPTEADIYAARLIERSLHPCGQCVCEGAGDGDWDWCVMNRRREAREERPARRAEQKQAKAARRGVKRHRGWA